LSDLGRWDEAIRAYEGALAVAPGAPDILVALAGALRQALRVEEARLRCREALDRAPTHREALALLSELSVGLPEARRGRPRRSARCCEVGGNV
jgi:tetratricopeptide (TPR) repeat protein